MNSEYWEAFFTLHRDLPREGPGEAADVAWAAERAQLPASAHIADVACGPGADIGALLEAAPEGEVTALDKQAHFIAAARAQWGDDPRTTILRADMAAIANPYDMIWCAGAVYFLGIEKALKTWRKSLRAGGVIAFTEPCWFTATPSERSKGFWADYPSITDANGIAARVAEAGYETLGVRKISDAAWENYFTPLDARIAALLPDAEGALKTVLIEAREEADCWRAHRDEFGYLLSVVRPA